MTKTFLWKVIIQMVSIVRKVHNLVCPPLKFRLLKRPFFFKISEDLETMYLQGKKECLLVQFRSVKKNGDTIFRIPIEQLNKPFPCHFSSLFMVSWSPNEPPESIGKKHPVDKYTNESKRIAFVL